MNRMLMIATVLCAAAAPALAGTPKLSPEEAAKFERDRKAILAMAGEYRVNFHFHETVPLQPGYEKHEAHDTGATEFVEVVEDSGDLIVLQHVLVLAPGEDDGEEGEGPRVVKHWRQDWEYEATKLYEYRGHNTWAPRELTAAEAEGTWTQRVFQVDDSPRYQSFGAWEHAQGASSWTGNTMWRPLPRREYTTRSDYHVLAGVNRHTLTPEGWVHEQDNRKLVLAKGAPASDAVALVREFGQNDYHKLSPGEVDFTPGRAYWERTQAYWADVRAAWDELFAAGQPIQLANRVDDKPLYRHLFDGAETLTENGYDSTAGAEHVRGVLAKFLQASSTGATAQR